MRSPLTSRKSHQAAVLVSSLQHLTRYSAVSFPVTAKAILASSLGVSIPSGFASDPTGPSGVSDVTSVTFAVAEPISVTAATSSSPPSGPKPKQLI